MFLSKEKIVLAKASLLIGLAGRVRRFVYASYSVMLKLKAYAGLISSCPSLISGLRRLNFDAPGLNLRSPVESFCWVSGFGVFYIFRIVPQVFWHLLAWFSIIVTPKQAKVESQCWLWLVFASVFSLPKNRWINPKLTSGAAKPQNILGAI